MREAIAYAIDRKDIVSRVYASNAQAVDVPIPPDAWYYDSDLRMYDYQPLKVHQIPREAGWKIPMGMEFLIKILERDLLISVSLSMHIWTI